MFPVRDLDQRTVRSRRGLGESCAEPSEGGMLKPLTAESIIARWMSMIIEMSPSVKRWDPEPLRMTPGEGRGGERATFLTSALRVRARAALAGSLLLTQERVAEA